MYDHIKGWIKTELFGKPSKHDEVRKISGEKPRKIRNE